MARTVAGLPAGTRLSDYISLGVFLRYFPRDMVQQVLSDTGRESVRHRLLPAQLMVYYVIALALYMNVSYGEVLRCLVEGLEWLGLPVKGLRGAQRSSISEARSRLGSQPLERLYCQAVKPVACQETQGAWYKGRRLVSIDGSTLDIADSKENEARYGRPGASRGKAAFPQLRFVALAEIGTRVLFDVRVDSINISENAMADEMLPSLKTGMLCLADRNFFSFKRWKSTMATGADLLWRMKGNMILPCIKRLADGSYLSTIYATAKDRRNNRNGITVRVIEYKLRGADSPTLVYRLLTTLLDPEVAPAKELAALYHERWEIETAFAEFKTQLRGKGVVLRSKTPELVRQEFYGLVLAHFAIRALMHEAALREKTDVDELSFIHAVRVVRRRIPKFVASPP